MINSIFTESELLVYTARLLAVAFEKSGLDISPIIEPLTGKFRFRDSVTMFNDLVLLWYNTPDHSTMVVSMAI
jgi:hypothetical protein